MRKIRWQVPMAIVLFFLCIFLTLQFKAQSSIGSDLSMQKTENLIAMVRDLSEKRQALSLEIADLNFKYHGQLESFQDEKKLAASIQDDLAKLNILTGATPVKGRGLSITFDSSMPVLYIDLISIINELWAAGAEAIAINDHRITARSDIYFSEDNQNMRITVNNAKLEFPIVIKALGNPNNLEKGLTIPGGIIDNLALFKAYPYLQKFDIIEIPASTNNPVFYFLQEYKAPEDSAATPVPPTRKS